MLERLTGDWSLPPPVVARAHQAGISMSQSMSQRDDDALAADAQRDRLLTAVYAEYSSCIHSYAFHLLGNQEDADDVTQEVFIRAHAHLDELREPTRLRPWLYRIATNLCMDHLRRRTRQHKFFGTAVPFTSSARDGEKMPREIAQPGSTAMIDGVAERDHIAAALRRMPNKYATCLLLHGEQGLSYREIADVLGISPGAAAVRLTRARDLFGRYYEALKKEVGP